MKAPYAIPAVVGVQKGGDLVLMWRPEAMRAVEKKEATWPPALVKPTAEEFEAMTGKNAARTVTRKAAPLPDVFTPPPAKKPEPAKK